MLTRSSEWIFNPMHYTGFYIRIYDLYKLGVVYFTCIEIRSPSFPDKMNNKNNIKKSREISREKNLGFPGLSFVTEIANPSAEYRGN